METLCTNKLLFTVICFFNEIAMDKLITFLWCLGLKQHQNIVPDNNNTYSFRATFSTNCLHETLKFLFGSVFAVGEAAGRAVVPTCL